MSEHPSPRRTYSTQLLVDLVMDPRDPGYEAAASRHGGTPVKHWYDTPAVAAGTLVIGLLLAIAWVHTHRGAPDAAKVHDDLVSRVRTAQHRDDGLALDLQRLSAQLDRVRAGALSSAQSQQLSREQLLAGEQAVHGPGLTVTLTEPTVPAASTPAGRGSRVPPVSGSILTDRDVRSVVNELWHDGAEAISVNDIRLTPDSAIRFAGDAVLVDFQPIDSPYVVRAIGNSDALAVAFADSDAASRYQTLRGAKGIGFSFDGSSDLELPGSVGPALRYATPGSGR